jgi:hypothetical protein
MFTRLPRKMVASTPQWPASTKAPIVDVADHQADFVGMTGDHDLGMPAPIEARKIAIRIAVPFVGNLLGLAEPNRLALGLEPGRTRRGQERRQ